MIYTTPMRNQLLRALILVNGVLFDDGPEKQGAKAQGVGAPRGCAVPESSYEASDRTTSIMCATVSVETSACRIWAGAMR